ncbi:MAG: CCA tRNA nucleotidyltransferase, partial [Planctomycetes bacterium]|nr:CCA tRNA nucleotidyltransferase [Planctomycetota bacterium]
SRQKTTLAGSGLIHHIGKTNKCTASDRILFNNHDLLGAEMAVAVLTRLRRSRRVTDGVYDLIRRHIHFSTLRKMRKSKLRRWLQDSSFPMHLELHRLDCESSHRMLANWFFGVQAWREEKARPPEPEPLFRGGARVALGLPPGPEIGKSRAAGDAA